MTEKLLIELEAKPKKYTNETFSTGKMDKKKAKLQKLTKQTIF